jgi:DNA-binding transcriptional LysR family regulator
MKPGGHDLNLLVALDALLTQRSVTRAAEQMGLSQPALSASLGRLRRHFGDELLVRAGNEYRLSALGAQLKESTRVAMLGVERVFTAAAEFHPATSDREFCLLASDYWVAVHGGHVAAAVAAAAPGARVRVALNTPAIVDDAARSLTRHDLLLMPHGYVTDLRHRDLYRDEWVCLVSADNPQVGEALSTGQLASMPWVMTFHGPTSATPATRQLRMRGVEPRAQVITETFLTVPGLVAGTDRVALLQRRLVEALPALLDGVRVLDCPFELSPFVEAMWWHPMYDEDSAHLWLREMVVTALTGSADGVR